MKSLPIQSRQTIQRLGFGALTLLALLAITPIVAIVGYIVVKGAPAISWQFLTAFPREGMKAGGIWPAILGTVYLTLGTAIFSVPLGLGAAIYLSEYAPNNRWTRLIRLSIVNLAGIPSVVYGLFGVGLFVLFLNFGISILADDQESVSRYFAQRGLDRSQAAYTKGRTGVPLVAGALATLECEIVKIGRAHV